MFPSPQALPPKEDDSRAISSPLPSRGTMKFRHPRQLVYMSDEVGVLAGSCRRPCSPSEKQKILNALNVSLQPIFEGGNTESPKVCKESIFVFYAQCNFS